MITKIWHKFFLLAVLSFMPMLSQAQSCTTGGILTKGAPEITPFPGGWKVAARFTMNIVLPNCTLMLRQLNAGNGQPDSYTQNGVSVKIRDAKIKLAGGTSVNCFISGVETPRLEYSQCHSFPVLSEVIVEYTLTGKSTATNSNTLLFRAGLDSFGPGITGSQTYDINVHASTAPTCSFLIDPHNITLGAIKNTDIETVTAGTAINTAQKNINLNVTCAADALSTSATFAPQFTPRNSTVLTNSSHVALNDEDDNGVGFKLFDPSGFAIAFSTPLSSSENLFSFGRTSLQTVSKTYTIKYAKTSTAVKAGSVTSSIVITFSIR